jgi:NAD(P)-dependent dehydrogenase (short-subunit alcohol dehydrogenase family)
MPDLNGSVVLLTGGATGIGRAIALEMAAAGATVAIGDTNADDGQRTAAEILRAGGRASFRSCDVAQAEQVAALVDGAVADFGQLDVLVNDAVADFGPARLHELDIDAWDRTIAVNLRGTFLCARAGARPPSATGPDAAPARWTRRADLACRIRSASGPRSLRQAAPRPGRSSVPRPAGR